MREMFFEDNIDDVKYCGHLYGLGTSFVNGENTAISSMLVAVATTNATSSSEGSIDNSSSVRPVTDGNNGNNNATPVIDGNNDNSIIIHS